MVKPVVPIVRKLISSSKVGVVVSAGKMSRAVKVRIAGQEWNKKFRKHFPSEQTYLVADPNNSLVEGDVVRIASGWRTSKSIRHVVTSIVAPFGSPVEDRTPVLTEEQRMEIRIKERLLKDVRSAERGRRTSIERLAQARKQGYKIPSLSEAMANVRIAEEEERMGREGGRKERHGGQAGQILTAKERRVERGRETKEERGAEKKVREASVQTA
ncbi:nucleic acid-binding protein [Trematosphaeria pertusa]|uniref:Nucleic acid-binding protein n=1 Tax=Trematosphaeria pertusa TaxID=390896 RepID=A0A6A6I550_9PLEO|nr:nucleic acid-binding protein [Trematosphaeria pertusa]KAF2244710.1 nucleic acid-binding protein [Trematosphaeria pertusa]